MHRAGHRNRGTDYVACCTRGAPARQLNPDPQRSYAISVVVAAPPGPFAAVSGVAQYDVSNAGACAKGHPVVGNIPVLTENVPFELSKVSETQYVGVIFQDRLQDEDYHGRGGCHWVLNEARVVFKASADSADARFVSGIPGEEVSAEGSRTRYFWKGYYPRAKIEGFPDLGEKDLQNVPEHQRAEFFTITLSAKRGSP